jgi:hypothetical protein
MLLVIPHTGLVPEGETTRPVPGPTALMTMLHLVSLCTGLRLCSSSPLATQRGASATRPVLQVQWVAQVEPGADAMISISRACKVRVEMSTGVRTTVGVCCHATPKLGAPLWLLVGTDACGMQHRQLRAGRDAKDCLIARFLTGLRTGRCRDISVGLQPSTPPGTSLSSLPTPSVACGVLQQTRAGVTRAGRDGTVRCLAVPLTVAPPVVVDTVGGGHQGPAVPSAPASGLGRAPIAVAVFVSGAVATPTSCRWMDSRSTSCLQGSLCTARACQMG